MRKTARYARFEGQNAFGALRCIQLFEPVAQLFLSGQGKTSLRQVRLFQKLKFWTNLRYKKIYEKDTDLLCQRFLEEEFRRRKAALNLVQLKNALDMARNRFLKFSVIEPAIPSSKVS